MTRTTWRFKKTSRSITIFKKITAPQWNQGRKLIAREDADEQCYQILGMALKAVDERKEADKMYKRGIKKFPGSGELYNEYGEMLWANKDAEAIRFWERGIEVDPSYSSNYYNASKFLLLYLR